MKSKASKMKVADIKANENNPRTISKVQFNKLKDSIDKFPDMLNLRPLVVDKDNVVVGGNMRLKALRALGITEVPVMKVADMTEEERRQFIIKDNVGFGDWDWDILANEWDVEELDQWGLPLPFSKDELEEMGNPDNAETEHPFATEIDREHNYVVLKFETDIDWIQAKTLLGLGTETAKRANGKPWSSGIGRVVDGVKALKKLQNAN
jgi:hypothetical protein